MAKGADCKSAGLRLRRFKSYLLHHASLYGEVMKSLAVFTALTLAVGMALAADAVRLDLPAAVRNEINVTTNSSPGWIPTAEQRQRALKTVQTFLDAVEGRRYVEAYGQQNELIKRSQTLAQFTQEAQKFSALAGPVKLWTVLKVTWTKDPAQAPLAGIYAAIDLAGQFADVDRDCGYMVLYQQSADGDFTIVRRENNYLDNATARDIEQKQSKAAVAKVWGNLARHCPNYVSLPSAR